MDETTARKIFEKAGIDVYSVENNPDNLSGRNRYIEWVSYSSKIIIDNEMTAEEMEALAWWMKNKKKEVQE